MCLYEREINNPKYLPNKKNNGIAPHASDKRLYKIKNGCGWCIECRKKIARDWLIRLNEEIKTYKNANFMSFSISAESIIHLEKEMYRTHYKGIEEYKGETDVNQLASFAIRRWTERYRKKTKKAPKHFLITELGHTSSERIHLHGITWGDQKTIIETWKYGNVDVGEWVDERTIKYITKYITKIDKDHPGYKQKIFTSKGMGKEYIEKNKDWHKFANDKTKTKYKLNDGREIELPRYYKEKLWNEEEREKLYLINLEKNEIWLAGEKIEKNINLEDFNKKLETVRENNKRAGYGDNKTVIKKYIITEAMKKHYKEIKRNDKLVKCVNKRKIVIYEEKKEGIQPSKSNNTEKIIYGQYIGTTTDSERKYNELLKEAQEKKISIRTLRLIKAGIINENYIY